MASHVRNVYYTQCFTNEDIDRLLEWDIGKLDGKYPVCPITGPYSSKRTQYEEGNHHQQQHHHHHHHLSHHQHLHSDGTGSDGDSEEPSTHTRKRRRTGDSPPSSPKGSKRLTGIYHDLSIVIYHA